MSLGMRYRVIHATLQLPYPDPDIDHHYQVAWRGCRQDHGAYAIDWDGFEVVTRELLGIIKSTPPHPQTGHCDQITGLAPELDYGV
jgi:hypothetical protein